ncbi:phenazine biosynthesis PhzC/PhzF protein [Parathielavia appendiculata]|uniref:Phenazine biosynthesis PhzC/PhzF protein n=1 Tax=Parathielavia appendiculata TaxID=2587402 RepID=A0AAN6TRY0_9PEZI|nr:phenazine biosynthesis PhzC/PhzF protein [Parathielavia appendiculata]
MTSVPFTIADIFSTVRYKGNPLAIVDARNEDLTDTQMKLITRQFNLSETTFFFPPTLPGADFRLRSFLPGGRRSTAPAAGVTESFVFHQELGGEVIPVQVTRHTEALDGKSQFSVSLRQATPQAHSTHPDPAGLAARIKLTAQDIGLTTTGNSGRQPQPQVMSTSTTRHLLVPVSSVAALNRAVVQRDRLLEQLRRVDDKAYGLYLFTRVPSADGTSTQTFQARFFSPGLSGEDPATGSAAGPLSAYLYYQGILKLSNDGVGRILVHQGSRVGRECVIHVELRLRQEGGQEVLDVDLIGSGVQVAEGRIDVPDFSTTF